MHLPCKHFTIIFSPISSMIQNIEKGFYSCWFFLFKQKNEIQLQISKRCYGPGKKHQWCTILTLDPKHYAKDNQNQSQYWTISNILWGNQTTFRVHSNHHSLKSLWVTISLWSHQQAVFLSVSGNGAEVLWICYSLHKHDEDCFLRATVWMRRVIYILRREKSAGNQEEVTRYWKGTAQQRWHTEKLKTVPLQPGQKVKPQPQGLLLETSYCRYLNTRQQSQVREGARHSMWTGKYQKKQ